jgi:hypothetical protein
MCNIQPVLLYCSLYLHEISSAVTNEALTDIDQDDIYRLYFLYVSFNTAESFFEAGNQIEKRTTNGYRYKFSIGVFCYTGKPERNNLEHAFVVCVCRRKQHKVLFVLLKMSTAYIVF